MDLSTPPVDSETSQELRPISIDDADRGTRLKNRVPLDKQGAVDPPRFGLVLPTSSAVRTPRPDTFEGNDDETVQGDKGASDGQLGVALVPGKRYLESSSLLDELGFWLHSGLRVLICRRCNVALSSKVAVGHLTKQHTFILSEVHKRELANVCVLNNVYENLHEVRLPRPGGPPVEGIAPPVAGLSCAAISSCRYSVRDLQAMIKHGREKHRGGTVSTTKYRASKVQALFRGVGRAYFEVDPELSASSDISTRDYLRTVFLQEAAFDEVITADGSRGRPPLLNVTHWDEFMPEIREDMDQRRAAHSLKAKHTVDERHGVFSLLQETVFIHHKTTRQKLQSSGNPFMLRKVLLNGSDFQAERSKWYFTMLLEDDNNYTRLFVQMIRTMVRARLGHPCIFKFEYTEHQAAQLDSLVDCLQGAVQQPEMYQPMLQQAYQTFCWTLVYNPTAETLLRWEDPIERFIWLMALGEGGNFMQASDLTPLLAKLKYFCRLITLHEALVFQNGERPREGMIERVGHHHLLALRPDRLSTFNMISELQQFATSLALSQTKDPKVFVDPNFEWIKIKKETLYLDALRGGIQELIKQIKESFILLSGDTAWPQLSGTSHIQDDLENVERGYCFLEESPYREARYSFFLAAVERCRLGTFIRPQEWAWDIAAIRSFLDRADELWGHVRHLLYVGLHLSTRVTQILEYQFCNADRPRNLVFQGTEGISITRYSKTTNLKGTDVCIPAFLSAPLREILLVLLGSGFRDAQAILAGIVYGRKARWLYRTYLCVERGERITPDNFYEVLRKRNQRFFGCAWGARDFRQGMITLGREFISPNEAFPCADEVLAEAADHTTEIDATHYANVHGAFPQLSNNTLCQQRWLSEEWSSLLGLGPHPPQDPVRLVRKTRKERQNINIADLGVELTEIISKAVTVAVMHKLELAGLPEDLLKKCAELRPLPATNSPPSAPPVYTQATIVADLSLDAQEWVVPEERSEVPLSSSLDISIAPETPKCDGTMPLDSPVVQGLSGDMHPSDPVVSQLGCMGSSLSLTKSLGSGADDSHASSKRRRDKDVESSPLQEPIKPSKRLRYRDESERPQFSWNVIHQGRLEPESLDDLCVSYPLADSREHNFDHLFTVDTGPDTNDQISGVGVGMDLSNSHSGAQEPLYTNVQKTHAESERILRSNIRGVMQYITGVLGTREKSRAQMLAILLVLRAETDAIITIRTGGGKSMLWMVPPLLSEDVKFLVICPYRVLLDEQWKKAREANIRAFNYSHSKHIPPDVQILFLQVEHIGSKEFDAFLFGADCPKFTHLFIDECHDILTCPLDRQAAWQKFTEWATVLKIPIFLLSATIPPKLQQKLLERYHMLIENTAIVRSPTNRPEIGLHTITIPSLSPDNSLFRLVAGLENRLAANERILVYAYSRSQAERLAKTWDCAAYHSTLPMDEKDHNLHRWDRGETRVMVCTSAFGSGVDRSNVRFVVIYEPALDLLTTAQMLGRAGRDGTPSHAFFVTRDPSICSAKPSRDDQLPNELIEVVHKQVCKVYQLMCHLDGEDLPKRCLEIPGQLPCDICEPNSSMHQFAMQAIQDPPRSGCKLRTYNVVELSSIAE